MDALRKRLGIISLACDEVGVSRATYYNWYNTDPEFKAEADSISDLQTDFVEAQLLSLIKDGDTTATIFYLKTKGRKRGYSGKDEPPAATAPESATLPDAEGKKELTKRVKAKKDYIVKLLKKEGKYTAELSMQVTLTAQLMVRAELLADDMASPGYKPVLEEVSREGNTRGRINPKEKLFLDIQSQIQRALRALGMNTDSKDRKAGDDSLSEFIEQINRDD